MRRLIVPLLLLAAITTQAQIRPAALRGHVRFLADDLLEGRGTGTRGHGIAAAYVAAQYDGFGLEPGAGGGWFQSVPFRKTVPDVEQSTITIERDGATPVTLKWGEGFVSSGDPLREDARVSAPVIFVGYGITSPELKYDDYSAVDVKGKIVAFLSGAPSDFPNDLRAHYSASLTKMDNAADHGAVGMMTIRTPYDERISAWSRSTRQSKLGAMNWIEADGTPHAMRRELVAGSTLSKAGAESLLAGGPRALQVVFDDVERRTVRSFDTGARVTIHLVSKHERVDSPNVVGILRGSDPKLRDEYLVYSAHLDHLGISDPVDGDRINNGALDNASGIAAMLEIARAMSVLPARPKRSILFLATTGEEKGLRGADYFANNPTVPAESLVADINIDEILMLVPTKDVVPLGGEHSDLGDVVARVARRLNVAVSPDPYPEEVDFVRSDQYPFVKRGVPAVYIGVGYQSADPTRDAKKAQLAWISTIYHSPKDDMSQPLDYSIGVMVARFDYELGLEVANAAKRPRWKKGDFFGDKFGR